MRIFITAFEPFGGRSCNTSADLLQAIVLQNIHPGMLLVGHAILPVDFDAAWPELKSHLDNLEADLVFLMGEKKGGYLTIESHARNRQRLDTTIKKINDSTRQTLQTPLPVKQLRASLPVNMQRRFKLSHNAGDYLCNFIYFKMLEQRPDLVSLFLHVPVRSPEQLRQRIDADVKAVVALLSSLKKYFAPTRNHDSDTKAIDGAGANDMPRENQRRLLMADKHLVACEQEHEMITVLKHFKKGSSKENVDKMQNACRSWKKDSGAKYKPKNRDNFYKYLQEKGVLGKLS